MAPASSGARCGLTSLATRSALLTQTVLGGHAAEHTAPYLSTIADTILNLDYSIDKARDRLGYDPPTTFDDGMDRTFACLKPQGLA